MDLFAEVETPPPTIDTETGEVDLFGENLPTENLAQREAEMQAAREALGLTQGHPISINTEDDLKAKLLQRLHIVAELEEAQRAVAVAQSKLKSWHYLYEIQCEAYYNMNPPKSGKTLTTPVGSLSMRSVPASYSLDETDRDEEKFGAWLAEQKDKHEAWGVKPIQRVTYTRNLTAIKKHLMEQTKAGKPVIVPGLKFTPARESFSIKQGGK